MSEWIECNLPWDPRYYEPHVIEGIVSDIRPELDRLYKERLGELIAKRDELWEAMKTECLDEFEMIDFEKAKAHPLNAERNEWIDRIKEAEDMIHQEPVCVEYDRRIDEYNLTMAQLTFCGQELNKPGTLVEVNEKQFLIGHINSLNTDAGCCGGSAFKDEDVVTRYKVIWNG